jgi:hypothetical protein
LVAKTYLCFGLNSEFSVLRRRFTSVPRSESDDANIETTRRVTWNSHVSTTSAHTEYVFLADAIE